MAKELYLYSPIYSFVAESVISQLEDNMSNDVTLRTLTPGGSVFAAYGIYAKMKEHGNVHLKVDGAADSAGSFMPMYAKSTEALDVSRFTFHRADMFVENADEQAFLDGVNKDLKAQMLKKIDPEMWKEVTGTTIDEMFDPTTRKDITLNGTQAKKVGLIQKVVKLTPEIEKSLAAFNNKLFNVAATTQTQTQTNPKIMDINKLKAEHPAVYDAIFASGVAKEKERVEAFMVFNEIDPVAVKKAIEDGKDLSQKQTAEFGLKMFSTEKLKAIKKDSPGATETEEEAEAKTEKEKELSAFSKAVKDNLKTVK